MNSTPSIIDLLRIIYILVVNNINKDEIEDKAKIWRGQGFGQNPSQNDLSFSEGKQPALLPTAKS